jgi:hypothetical protein
MISGLYAKMQARVAATPVPLLSASGTEYEATQTAQN